MLTIRARMDGRTTRNADAVAVRSVAEMPSAARPSNAVITMAMVGRRRPMTPAAAANRTMTARTLPMRIGLSALPNASMAQFLTGVGVQSMTRLPTAMTGLGTPVSRLETPLETARPATAARTPAPAACSFVVTRYRLT
jgi:hypothetical protein